MNNKLVLITTVAAALLAGLAIVPSTATAQDKGDKGGKKGGIQLPPMIHITVADFADGGRIPAKYT